MTASPLAVCSPAVRAAWWPKLRDNSTTLRCASWFWISSSSESDPSRLPSFKYTIYPGSRMAAIAATTAPWNALMFSSSLNMGTTTESMFYPRALLLSCFIPLCRLCCFFKRSFDRCRPLACDVRPPHTVIIESNRLHKRRTEQVAPVYDNGVSQQLLDPHQIQRGKVFPFRQHQAGVRSFQGFIAAAREFDGAIGPKFLRRVLHGRGIVSGNRTSFLEQALDNGHGRRLTQIVSAVLEGQSQHRQLFAFEGPQRFSYFAHETVSLLFIDPDGFIQQAEVAAVFTRHRSECKKVLGKTRTAVPDSGREKAPADARIRSDAFTHLLHICAYRFTHAGYRVDERYLHRQEGVGSVLDQLRALGAGADQMRLERTCDWAGNRIGFFVIAAIHQRLVSCGHHVRATIAVGAHHDAIGKQKIGHRCAFAQELWIGGNVKKLRRRAVKQHDLAYPAVGIDRNRALFHHNFIVVNGAGDSLGHRFHVRKVGIAVILGRRTHGDEDQLAAAYRSGQVTGKVQPLSPVPFQQF